jgi:hypothetical protein
MTEPIHDVFSNLKEILYYYLLMEESGQGCGYTIGCGTVCVPLNAKNREMAEAEVREKVEYYGLASPRSEHHLKEFKLLEVSEAVDLMPVLASMKNEAKAQADEEIRAQKRAQLEQLKQELGE